MANEKSNAAVKTAGLANEIGKQKPFDLLQQEAYLNLVRTHEVLSSQFAQLFKKHGVSDPQYNALRILKGEDKPLQIYQIAERMVSPQTDISRLVDRLVAAGLVSRERCGDDRRVVWVELTADGKNLLRKLGGPVKKLHESQFGKLSSNQLKQLNKLLFQARQ